MTGYRQVRPHRLGTCGPAQLRSRAPARTRNSPAALANAPGRCRSSTEAHFLPASCCDPASARLAGRRRPELSVSRAHGAAAVPTHDIKYIEPEGASGVRPFRAPDRRAGDDRNQANAAAWSGVRSGDAGAPSRRLAAARCFFDRRRRSRPPRTRSVPSGWRRGAGRLAVRARARPPAAPLRHNRGVRVERNRENVFTVTATGQELSALIAGARLALDAMRASPDTPAAAIELLGRVLDEFDRSRQQLSESPPNGDRH